MATYTSVGIAGDFTDRSLWPLGHPPVKRTDDSEPLPCRTLREVHTWLRFGSARS